MTTKIGEIPSNTVLAEIQFIEWKPAQRQMTMAIELVLVFSRMTAYFICLCRLRWYLRPLPEKTMFNV